MVVCPGSTRGNNGTHEHSLTLINNTLILTSVYMQTQTSPSHVNVLCVHANTNFTHTHVHVPYYIRICKHKPHSHICPCTILRIYIRTCKHKLHSHMSMYILRIYVRTCKHKPHSHMFISPHVNALCVHANTNLTLTCQYTYVHANTNLTLVVVPTTFEDQA